MPRARRRTSFLALLLLAGSVPAVRPASSGRPPGAAANPWQPYGPGGGSVRSITVDPHDPAIVYAIGGAAFFRLYGTLFKSTDGGATWTPRGLARVMALDPERPETIYAGGGNLLRSDDGGLTWSDISPPSGPYGLGILALAAAPGGVVLAADGERLLRSADGGRSWSVVARDSGVDIRSILVDPADPRRVYSLSDHALSRSGDGGAHWTLAGQPGRAGTFFEDSGFALAPSAPRTLYVAIPADRVFRSDDGAATWRAMGRTPSGDGPLSLLVDPRLPDRLYAAGGGDPFTSADGGRSWRRIDAGLPPVPGHPSLPVDSLALAPSRPQLLFAGTEGWGVARSRNAGLQWRLGDATGFHTAGVAGLYFHPRRPGTVYLFQDAGRTFRSTDDGRSWQPFARDLSRNGLASLAFDPADPDLLYASSSTGTWKSPDGGAAWVHVSTPRAPLAAVAPRTLLDASCGIQRSTDGGRSWKETLPCGTADGDASRYPRSLWVDPRSPRTAYVHFYLQGDTHPFGQEAYRSRDGGVTWTRLALVSPSSFAVAPGDSHILYAVDQGILLRSADGGESWKVVNRNISFGGYFGQMAVSAADPDTLYAPADPLLISRDGGATFSPINRPFQAGNRRPALLWTDRDHPGLLWAESGLGGLYLGRFE